MKNKFLPVLLLIFIVALFFRPFLLQQKLPIPSDTIIGLYYPFKDLYANNYPNGIPYKNFLITDPVRQQYPWRWLAFTSEKQGELPLWNPYSMSGSPLLATMQPAAFYPLNILFFLLPFPIAWSTIIFLEQILAAVFLYCYLQNLRLKRLASFLGALAFSFSGFFIAWLEWGTVLHVALWLPLLLLSIDKLFFNAQVKNIKIKNYYIWFLVFIFALTASLLAGHIQTFFYVFLVSLIYFFVRWLQFGRQLTNLFLFFLCIIIFLIVSVIQWLPTLQFINESARNIDQINSLSQDGWFIPWQHLVQFVAPDFFGNPATLNYWGVWNYGELVGYVGIFPLILATFALLYRHDRKTLFFGSLFFLSLIFSLPTIFAKLPYLFQIPFLSTSQPTRLLFITDFCLVILAALGFDRLLSEKKVKMQYVLMGVGVLFFLLWLFVLIAAKITPFITPEQISVAKHNLYLPTILFIVVSALLFALTKNTNKKIHMALLIGLVIITLFDLFRFSQKFIPFTNKEYLFPPAPVLSYIQKQPGQFRIMTTDDKILPPNFSIMYHLQSIDGYDPLYLRRYGELIAAINRKKPDITPPFGFNRIITSHSVDSRLIDLLGVRYVLSLSDIDEPGFKKVTESEQTKVYENTHAFPRAFFVQNVQPVTNKQQAINALFDKTIDLKKTAVVEGWEEKEKLAENNTTKIATIGTYKANTVTIKTNNREPAFLVLVDIYYPTWRAKICSEDETKCEKTTLYRTDFAFRGIVVPEGKHIIIFYNSLL